MSLIAWILSFTQDTMWELIAFCLFYTSYSVIFNRVTPFLTQMAIWILQLHSFLTPKKIFWNLLLDSFFSNKILCEIWQLGFISHTKYSILSSAWLPYLIQDTRWDLAAWLPYFTQDSLQDLTGFTYFVTQMTMWILQIETFLSPKILGDIYQLDPILSHK